MRPFAGSPMISWPIKAAIETGLFQNIYVSTDNQEVAETSQAQGAEIIWRPIDLAGDYTGTTAVLKNALETALPHLPAEHFVYKIYATAPVTAPLLREFVSFAESEPERFSVSVGKFRNPIERAMAIAEGNRLHFREPQHVDSRSQDLRDHFFDAGKLYFGTTSAWKATKSALLENPRGFTLPIWASIDIDTEDDWLLAELLFTQLRGN